MKPITFTSVGGRHDAYYEARLYLQERGFSVGIGQTGVPTGFVLGNRFVPGWNDMTQSEREALDGVIIGDKQLGPISFRLLPRADLDAQIALLLDLPEVEA